ncbi:MAG: hypothetical protein V4631_21890 [Pseudomonadota bacterium]
MLLNKTLRAFVTLLLAAAVAQPALAANWQDTPDSLQLASVGDTLRLNGTPMQIRAFKSALPIERLLRDVQAGWQEANRSDVTRAVVSGWTVLNQTVGDQHRSFQARLAGDQVEGFVALTSPKQTREPKLVLRLPSDMTAISIIDSVDDGHSSQQVIAVSPRSFDASTSAIEAQLRAAGWERHVHKKTAGAVVFAANKGSQQFDATVSAQKNGSLIMLSVVTK